MTSRQKDIEDNSKLILDSITPIDRRKMMPKDTEDVDSILNNKSIMDQSARTFNLMDNFGQVLNKWSSKSDNINQTKANKSRVNDMIDPSLASGALSFSSEASERHSRIKARITDDFLGKQFRGSQILTDSEKIEGGLLFIYQLGCFIWLYLR
jgi:hypothetical protein